jgi:hypothetical protein
VLGRGGVVVVVVVLMAGAPLQVVLVVQVEAFLTVVRGRGAHAQHLFFGEREGRVVPWDVMPRHHHLVVVLLLFLLLFLLLRAMVVVVVVVLVLVLLQPHRVVTIAASAAAAAIRAAAAQGWLLFRGQGASLLLLSVAAAVVVVHHCCSSLGPVRPSSSCRPRCRAIGRSVRRPVVSMCARVRVVLNEWAGGALFWLLGVAILIWGRARALEAALAISGTRWRGRLFQQDLIEEGSRAPFNQGLQSSKASKQASPHAARSSLLIVVVVVVVVTAAEAPKSIGPNASLLSNPDIYVSDR